MNERILELIQQATRIVDDGPDLFSMPREIFDKELFAELIVRECACVANLTEDDEGDDYTSGRTWAGIDVLKHFGVEE